MTGRRCPHAGKTPTGGPTTCQPLSGTSPRGDHNPVTPHTRHSCQIKDCPDRDKCAPVSTHWCPSAATHSPMPPSLGGHRDR
nr:MAG TPA: hypothetical protein [Caudoviricetes sp.]